MKVYSDALVHTLAGGGNAKLRPLVFAVNIVAERLFEDGLNEDDIQVYKDVYYNVSKILGAQQHSTSKAVQRLAHRCWLNMEECGLLKTYIGSTAPKKYEGVRRMLVYLATYAYFSEPYYKVVQEHREYFLGNGTPCPIPPKPLKLRETEPEPVL